MKNKGLNVYQLELVNKQTKEVVMDVNVYAKNVNDLLTKMSALDLNLVNNQYYHRRK